MSPPTSGLWRIEHISNAGRGVLASQNIPAGTVVISSNPPAAHGTLRQYRREVCALCFHYENGRTLPVRSAEVGKVFCSEPCKNVWTGEQGQSGVECWQQLETFTRTRQKAISIAHTHFTVGPQPDPATIRRIWDQAEGRAKLQTQGRIHAASNSGPGIKLYKEYRKALHHTWTQTVDPDVLCFMLSGALVHRQKREIWAEMAELCADPNPYKTVPDLEAHAESYVQLVATMPLWLLPSLTAENMQMLICVASHNSFGLRSLEPDGDEYFGHGVYPEASYFNHSCEPNVSKRRQGRHWVFETSTGIEAGEELCITYLGGDENTMTVGERRTRQKSVWGFQCGCRRCEEQLLQ